MKNILTFKLFENLQQADSYLGKKSDEDLEKFYGELLGYLKDKPNKYNNYIFPFVIYYEYTRNKDEVMNYFKKIVENNLTIDINDKDINPSQVIKWKRISEDEKEDIIKEMFKKFKDKVDFLIIKRPTMKFIEKNVPGFLKPEMKKHDNIIKLGKLEPWEIEESKLKGMVSLFKDASEYINFIKNIKSDNNSYEEIIKNKEDLEIISDENNYIVYKPKSFEAMNCVVYNYWCTIDRKEWNKYTNADYDIYVLYNKKDIENSYMLLVRDDDFYVSDYFNHTLFTDEDIEDKIDNMPVGSIILLKEVEKVDNNLKSLLDIKL